MATRMLRLAVTVSMLTYLSGCGLVGVEMTSTPDSVAPGDPVTFDIKLTNNSPCPTESVFAVLTAFIPARVFDAEFMVMLPPDTPPEIIQFLQELRAAFEELCAGGTPIFPTPPDLAMACQQDDGAVVCDVTRRAQGGQSGGTSMTFAPLGDRLRCQLDAGALSCRLRLPLPDGAAGGGQGSAAAAAQPLTCLTGQELGLGDDAEAFCFIGSFGMPEGLDPGEMATGQITLPARGAGLVRNLVFSIGADPDEIGVCKGGAEAGQACDRSDTMPCPGSTCGEGICAGGANEGLGCDVATQAMDCPGSTCDVCSEPLQPDFLPLDCTNTIVGVQPAPVMSPWLLAATGLALLAIGTLWQRRRARS